MKHFLTIIDHDAETLRQLIADAARLKAAAGRSEADAAQHTLIAADIKRFLERPAEVAHTLPAPPAPPGAPIGDPPLDWLAPPPW